MSATGRHPRPESTMEESPATHVEHSSEETHKGNICPGAKELVTATSPTRRENSVHVVDTTIVYLDACNLYGWSMSQYLPTGCFMWVELSRKTVSDEEASRA